MKVIKKGIRTVRCVAEFNRDDIQKPLNLYYLGSEACNYVNEEGIIVAKEHENRYLLEEKARNIFNHISLDIEADLTDEGTLVNFRVVTLKKGK